MGMQFARSVSILPKARRVYFGLLLVSFVKFCGDSSLEMLTLSGRIVLKKTVHFYEAPGYIMPGPAGCQLGSPPAQAAFVSFPASFMRCRYSLIEILPANKRLYSWLSAVCDFSFAVLVCLFCVFVIVCFF